ncbi:MAG TPA: TerB family tellurite resistance protein [Pseudolabrys sp.]|nr:TerB family tellurite resistance protein [Pseudolabrys sp.]
MFNALRKLMADLNEGGKHPVGFEEDDYRVAAAALLVHAAAIDGSISEAERVKLHGLIKLRFSLDDAATDELVAAATAAEQKAVDLYHFTAKLNRSLDEAGCARIVEMMWQIVYVDGVITEFEDNLIWRAADLLGVSQAERIALRERVSAARTEGSKAAP